MKRKIAQGKVALGANIQEVSIQSIEILSLLGFDYLNIDCLHSPLSLESIVQIVQTAELRGITPIVRVPQNVPEVILRYLDVGVMGIIIADMDNAEVAQKLVRAVKYPPEGDRGLGQVRACDYGLTESMAEYIKSANRETMALGVVESREGIDHIEEILSTPGLDGVIIGATDLSKSLGVPGQTNHPQVQQAINQILAAGKKTGKAIGMSLRKVESPKEMIDKGFSFVGIHLKTLLISAARKYLEEARS